MRRVAASSRLLLAVGLVAGLTSPAVAQDTTGAAPAAAPETSTAAALDPDTRLDRENAEVIRLAERETADLVRPETERGEIEGDTLWGALVKMALVLGVVCLLAYLLLGKLLPRLMRVPNPSGRPRLMRVVDRLPVDQRRSLMLVAIGEEYFLVGASEGGINLISRLDADTVRRAETTAGEERSGLSRFAEALAGRGSKEP